MMYLAISQPMKDEDKHSLLDGLLENSFTFSEVEKKSQNSKSLQTAKEALLQKIECSTWDEGVEAVPKYCNEGT